MTACGENLVTGTETRHVVPDSLDTPGHVPAGYIILRLWKPDTQTRGPRVTSHRKNVAGVQG